MDLGSIRTVQRCRCVPADSYEFVSNPVSNFLSIAQDLGCFNPWRLPGRLAPLVQSRIQPILIHMLRMFPRVTGFTGYGNDDP